MRKPPILKRVGRGRFVAFDPFLTQGIGEKSTRVGDGLAPGWFLVRLGKMPS